LPASADDVTANLCAELCSSSSYHDGGTLGSDPQGDSPSDAGGGTDDKYDLVRQLTHETSCWLDTYASSLSVNAVGHGLPGPPVSHESCRPANCRLPGPASRPTIHLLPTGCARPCSSSGSASDSLPTPATMCTMRERCRMHDDGICFLAEARNNVGNGRGDLREDGLGRPRGHQWGLRVAVVDRVDQAENRMHTIKALTVATLGA
jgi:hypothetical protein